MSDLVERLNSLVAERAGGGPSEATYDPELLAIGFAVADRIEQLERVLALAKMALEYHTQQTRPIHGTAQAITAIDEALNTEAKGSRSGPA